MRRSRTSANSCPHAARRWPGDSIYILSSPSAEICVGGFRYSEGIKIQQFLQAKFEQEPGFIRAFSLGAFSNRGAVEWQDHNAMWAYMKKMKGLKIECEFADPSRQGRLWHGIDKYDSRSRIAARWES